MNKLEKEKSLLEQKLSSQNKKKEKYFKYKEKIDENNFLENKNLEKIYLNLDKLIEKYLQKERKTQF